MHSILHSLTSSQGNMGLLPFKVQQVPLKKEKKKKCYFLGMLCYRALLIVF